MRASVIIPTRRRVALLKRTLCALAAQTVKEFETVVVCDGDDTETERLAETIHPSYPLRWLFQPKRRGQAASRNAGATAARGSLLLFLDDDTLPDPDWLSTHLECHNSADSSARLVVYGKIIESYSSPAQSHTEEFLRQLRDSSLDDLESCYQRQQLDFERWACFGLNSSIRKDLFLAVGGFDPALQHLNEDMEMGTRLNDKGTRFLYEADAIVRHQNTKNLVTAFKWAAEEMGRADIYRARQKGQRSAQTRRLNRLYAGGPIRRLGHRLAWSHPDRFSRLAEMCQRVTDTLGLKATFWLWCRLQAARYWAGVRSAAETLESLAELAHPPCPTLLLHSISLPTEEKELGVCLSPGRFLWLLRTLKATGRETVVPNEWLQRRGSTRRVMLTFDDGYEDFYTTAFPALRKEKLHAVVFIVVDQIGKTNAWDERLGYRSQRLLTASQIRELHRFGVGFGSHGLTHRKLTELPNSELNREVRASKLKLEDLLGEEVTSFAYPFGAVDARVRAAVARAGYHCAFSASPGLNSWTDPLTLHRTAVYQTDSGVTLRLKLHTGCSPRDLVLGAGAYGKGRRTQTLPENSS